MRLSVLVRGAGLILLGGCLFAAGCQQHAPAPEQMRAGGIDPSAALPPASKDKPWVNPTYQDEASAAPLWFDYSNSLSFLAGLFNPVITLSESTMGWLSGDRPSQAVRLLEDGASPDNRRIGMNKLAEFGFLHHPVFNKRCRQIAQFDSDYTVRATAFRTENRARDAKASPLFIKNLDDKSEWVRLEAAKGLVNVPDMNAVAPLLRVVTDLEESRDVRVAAVDALKHYRTLEVARTLSSLLQDKSFVVAWQARRSLRYLTNRDYHYDEAAWLNYFTGPEKPLE